MDKECWSNYKAMSPVTLDWWLISTLVTLSTVHFRRGNWIGEAPYQHGRPCSQCPPSYGGGCRNNLCYLGEQPHMVFISGCENVASLSPLQYVRPSVDSQRSETEDMNEVEKPQVPLPPRTTAKPAPKPKPSAPKKPVSKPTTPRTPSSNTPSNTYLGSYRNDWK